MNAENTRKVAAYDAARAMVKFEGNTRAYYVLRAERAEAREQQFVTFMEGLAVQLEDLSVKDDTGQIFELSENVRKVLRRNGDDADLIAIRRVELILRWRGVHNLADDIYALGLLVGARAEPAFTPGAEI